jgi:prepilin-type N-terminal cleavage/methylation domain-containing protein
MRSGFTMLELLLALVVGSVLIASVFGVMINSSKEFRSQRETVDVRETLRGGATLLSGELRNASASRGDLLAISPESLAVRSFQSTGAVCGTSTKRYGISGAAGTFGSGADDSMLVSRTSGTTWNKAKVTAVWTNPGSPYVASCAAWTGTPVPPMVIELAANVAGADTLGVGVGSVVRGYRKTVYKLVSSSGRWWLARRVGAAGTYDIVTGPLLASGAAGGLAFAYYDAAGNVTANPAAVARVTITLRAESTRNGPVGATISRRRDSLRATTTLRN